MHLPLEIIPTFKNGHVYLTIFAGEASDTVGPILEGQKLTAVLSYEPPPPGRQPPSRKMRRRAAETEADIAKSIGGKTQPNSGAMKGAKGDVRKRGELRIEAKTTKTKSYHVTREELNKIRGECAFGEKPVFVINFVNPHTLQGEDQWVLQPYGDWYASNVDPGPRG